MKVSWLSDVWKCLNQVCVSESRRLLSWLIFMPSFGRPTIREGQEKSEDGNSPKHSGPSFRCPCLVRFSTDKVYIVKITSVFADNVSAMVRFEWNSVFWIINKCIHILTSFLLGQKKIERGSEVILSFKIWRKVFCYPCTLQVEGIFSKGTKAYLTS